MRKSYRIEVDCANCAGKMEAAAQKTPGVLSASVSFMTQRMAVEFAPGEDPAKVMEAVRKNCRRVESDCEIYL